MKTEGSSWVILSTRIPVEGSAVYRAEVTIKKLSGAGTVYIGADSLDASYASVHADQAEGYNYFGARYVTLAAGTEKTFVGYISGFNGTQGGDHNKFDPGAQYFDLVILTNYGDNGNPSGGSSVIKSVHIEKVSGVYPDANGNVGIGTTAPSATLDVTGNAQIGRSGQTVPTDSYLRLAVGDGTGPVIKMFSDSSATNAMTSGIQLNTYGTGKFAGFMMNDNGIASNSTTREFYIGDSGSGIKIGSWGNNPLTNTATSFTSKMFLDASGNVGIGTTSPSYKLHVNGSAGGSDGWNSLSDARFKVSIETLEDSLDKILQLRGVSYEFNHEKFKDRNFEKGRQVGLIAQETEKVFPEVVRTDGKGFKSIAYPNLISPLIEAFKELHVRTSRSLASKADQSEIDRIQSENAQLKKENTEIRAYLCAKDPAAPICK